MSGVLCARCGAKASTGRLCNVCAIKLERALADLAAWLPELDAVVLRQDQVARANSHRPTPADWQAIAAEHGETTQIPARLRSKQGYATLPSTVLPVNLEAADLAVAVRFTLATWVAELSARNPDAKLPARDVRMLGPVCARHRHDYRPATDDRPAGCGLRDCRRLHCKHPSCVAIRKPATPVEPAIGWLQRNMAAVRRDDVAGVLVGDVLQAAKQVEQAVDSREPGLFLGLCDAPDVCADLDGNGRITTVPGICGAELYADLGDPIVTCRVCGWRYDIAVRRQWLLESARDVWDRPKVIADALTAMDMPLTPGRLDQWISRDRKDREAGRAVQDKDGRWARLRDGAPLILQVGTDYTEPVLDDDGKPLLDDDGVPLVRHVGRPVYRLGDVMARLDWANQRTEATG